MHQPEWMLSFPINSNKFPLSANLLSWNWNSKLIAEIMGHAVGNCFPFFLSPISIPNLRYYLLSSFIACSLNKNYMGGISAKAFDQFIYIRTWWMRGKGKNCNISRTLKLTLRSLCVSSGRVCCMYVFMFL